ncbi:MAG: alkylmercury lyase family protein [Ardenticatenaceae bacterium]|nr:alkylmercury lyase family protein [Ardenticatenaceae bacterium]MCB8947622.1 alkylmercury lyase family protein [Ardenticatenaceae bacterium]
MNKKLTIALKRLNTILPLKKNQDNCTAEIKELHQQILRSFVTNGRILTKEEMVLWVDDIPEAINVLSQHDMVTVSGSGEPIGAYPFTMTERVHEVHVNGHQVHAMCALDALAIGPMFKETTQITSQCAVTDAPVKIEMSGETILNLAEVQDVHFGIAWDAANAASCCADSLCLEMIFLRDTETAQQWLADDSDGREVFTLQEAVRFASQFFVPLLP